MTARPVTVFDTEATRKRVSCYWFILASGTCSNMAASGKVGVDLTAVLEDDDAKAGDFCSRISNHGVKVLGQGRF